MKNLVFLLLFVAQSAFAGTKWVTAATFGAVKKEDEKALLELAARGDKEAVLAMIKQGKCLPLARGTGGLWAGQDLENGLDLVVIPPDQRGVRNPGPDSKPLWIPRKFLSETQPPLSEGQEPASTQPVQPDSSLSPESQKEALDDKGDNMPGDTAGEDRQLAVSPPQVSSPTDQMPETAPAPDTRWTEERENGTITTAPAAGNHDFLLSIIRAMASYDWQVLTSHFIDKQTSSLQPASSRSTTYYQSTTPRR